jgi:hypothetical protein
VRAKRSKYEDGRPAIFRNPISGASNEILAPEGVQDGGPVRRRNRCCERRWCQDYCFTSLESDNAVEGGNASDGEISGEMLRNVIPPGWAGKPVHDGDTAKVEQDRRNARWFCECVSKVFVIPTGDLFTLRADYYTYPGMTKFSCHRHECVYQRRMLGKVLLREARSFNDNQEHGRQLTNFVGLVND